MDLGRLLTAIVTPFDDRMQVDCGRARALVERLIDQGSEGFVVCGTTGESPTVSHDEKLRMFEAVRDAASGKASVIANTGTYNTVASVELTRKAAKIGVDAVMAVVPYYNKPTQAGLAAHFTAIAEAADLPLIMYNIPGRTGCMMSAETTVRLSRVPNIAGVKDAVGNLGYTSTVAREAKEGFRIYSGDDSATLPMLAVGGHGVISVASHIAGPDIQSMVRSFLEGDHERATQIHLRLLPLVEALFCTTNPIGVKCALREDGFEVGGLRLPLTPATDDEAALIREALGAYRRRTQAA